MLGNYTKTNSMKKPKTWKGGKLGMKMIWGSKMPPYTIALLKNEIIKRNAIIQHSSNPDLIKTCEYENADMETALKILEHET